MRFFKLRESSRSVSLKTTPVISHTLFVDATTTSPCIPSQDRAEVRSVLLLTFVQVFQLEIALIMSSKA